MDELIPEIPHSLKIFLTKKQGLRLAVVILRLKVPERCFNHGLRHDDYRGPRPSQERTADINLQK